jgi:hypothetical protein
VLQIIIIIIIIPSKWKQYAALAAVFQLAK